MQSMKTDFQTLGRIVHRRLSKNMLIRQDVPGGGRLRIDRQLPSLCVCRPRGVTDAGTRDLVTSEALYLHATANPELDSDVVELCWEIASVLREHFGTF